MYIHVHIMQDYIILKPEAYIHGYMSCTNSPGAALSDPRLYPANGLVVSVSLVAVYKPGWLCPSYQLFWRFHSKVWPIKEFDNIWQQVG